MSCEALGWEAFWLLGGPGLRSVLALGAVDRVGELVQVGADGIEDAHDGSPVGAAPAALKARDESRVGVETRGELLLRETGSVA